MRARANASTTLFLVLALGQAACGALFGVADFDGGDPLGFGRTTPQEDGGVFSSLDSGAEDALLPTREDGGDTAGDGGWLLTDGGFVENDGGWLFDGGMVSDAAFGTEDAGTPGNVCPNGQHWSGSECAANVRACDIPNGNGVQVWSNGSWGICVRTTCDPGYREDGIACVDDCPNDPKKSARGICGCGVPDTDSDGDGTPDCNDGCSADAAKTTPGTCGCGVPDTDSDGDDTLDCNDGCPLDAAKTTPGACGCGVPDTDSDGDGTLDCEDACPNDAAKWMTPGVCGCGTADTDSDGDGTLDCNDQCPDHTLKTVPGICGCSVADTDSDGDDTPDCNDPCPYDGTKIEPGTCGCGAPDVDSDGDGTLDCEDTCPADSDKTSPGVCGCGYSDADADDDNLADCVPELPVVWNTLGRTLTIQQVNINGAATTTKSVAPGVAVTLEVAGNWIDSNTNCPTCITQFYAQMADVFSLCFGNSTEALTFAKSVTFNAPSTSGTYFVNLASSWQYSCVHPQNVSTERNATTIATIVVQ